MRLAEAVNYCICVGFEITRQGLTSHIKRGNPCFVKSSIKNNRAKIYREELDFFLEQALERVPEDEGWVLASEAYKIYGIPKSTMYYAIGKNFIRYKCVGSGFGIIYVREFDAKNYAKRYNR